MIRYDHDFLQNTAKILLLNNRSLKANNRDQALNLITTYHLHPFASSVQMIRPHPSKVNRHNCTFQSDRDCRYSECRTCVHLIRLNNV